MSYACQTRQLIPPAQCCVSRQLFFSQSRRLSLFVTQMFVTVLTTACYQSLSLNRRIQSKPFHLHLNLESGFFPAGFLTSSIRIYVPSLRATCPTHLTLLYLLTTIIFVRSVNNETLLQAASCTFLIHCTSYAYTSPSTPCFRKISAYFPSSLGETKFHYISIYFTLIYTQRSQRKTRHSGHPRNRRALNSIYT